jgi:hypothetical protein
MKILIATCSEWLPERKATLARLLVELEGADVEVLSSRRPEHATIWARRLWERAEDVKGPVCCLNDDVFTCPDFARVIDVVADVAKGRAISLHTSVPEAVNVKGPWLRSYWLTGPGYILPEGRATQLLDFWAKLPWAFMAAPGRNEDVIAIHEAYSRQEPLWSTIPALVRHDVQTRSSLGYDNHKLRVSPVDWGASVADLTSPDYWRPTVDAPPFVENPWSATPYLAAVRNGLAITNVCQACWQRGALMQVGGMLVCGACLSPGVAAVLRMARAS